MTRAQTIALWAIGALAFMAYLQSHQLAKLILVKGQGGALKLREGLTA